MKKLLLFALCVASLSACKKDSENTPSKMDLITAKNWRVTAATTTTTVTTTGSSPTVTTTNDYAQYDPCEKDNFYKFNTNKTLIFDEGPTKCNPSSPQTSTITWDFNGDQTKLITGTASSSSSSSDDILELSATTLRLRTMDSYTSGSTTSSSVGTVTFTAF
ncbi:MAG: hypothetical protein EOO63_07050 [Hymenobacter sp.]|nr:MAG: hypothetical protein EOO63_07050 [Hymenobacter sp.]